MNHRQDIYLHKPGMICSLGGTTDLIAKNLFSPQGDYLTYSDFYSPGKTLPLGLVQEKLASVIHHDQKFHSRNNQIILAALEQIQETIDLHLSSIAKERIGVVMGSSTSGIAEAEHAVTSLYQHNQLPSGYRYEQQEIGAPSEFIAEVLNIKGPVLTISTACSSGAKALASARRLIELGICDAVVCGGADSLCHLTVNGFVSLGSVSAKVCSPFKAQRDGINIGEGACIFVMSGLPPETNKIALLGVGETSDAHHISAPDPNAGGAIAAMRGALSDAQIKPSDIEYINLHGTATPQNDQMESLAINTVFGAETPCSSTKPLTGHTLGAAGALEAGFCWLTLNQRNDTVLLPPQMGGGDLDSALSPIALVPTAEQAKASLRYVLSNSFAFGGNNIALVLGALTE